MIRLIMESKDEYSNYKFLDINRNIYEVNINFMGVEIPTIGTYLYIPEKVLAENVSLNYGLIEDTSNISEDELIVMVKDDKKIYLQRFYG